ncbi:MAG: hypothetical protein JWL61_917 [Gemmatimonadetes bacterium]|nr:hypothetical protein [Gemmatimonadota bacterium]
MLLLVYVVTLAPGVTFWDAGEFIAAAHVFGIPHPPGTPLFVALGRAWSMLLGGAIGVARAMNLLSAVSTAAAGALSAWLLARAVAGERSASWGAVAGALCAGLMTSVWANATETEVYALSLLLVALMLACGERAGEGDRSHRWVLLTAYLIALAPAVHLSALVGAPAAIAFAARTRDGRWFGDRLLLLGGVLIASAGVGRMSWLLIGVGALVAATSALVKRAEEQVPHLVRDDNSSRPRDLLFAILLTAIAASALLIMLLRARHDPGVNQGNPSTLTTLADVVARRQYDVSPMWPRQAPVWLQVATLAQYIDWQFGITLGRGIFTTPWRLLVTLLFLLLGIRGWRAMRRDGKRAADALAVLTLSGTLGVVVYLNLKAGATIGYGFVPAGAHEARERDYFFVLGFWGWGLFAGYGALAFVRARKWPASIALASAVVPLLGNWTANDRPRSDGATAARVVAQALLQSAPRNALLFVAGDNDTYPLWYLQQVEGVRTDVTTVTMPLLPADWYGEELARRTGLKWGSGFVPGAQWAHQELAAHIARAARAAGRPVVASPSVTAKERALLGSAWRLTGTVYLSSAAANGSIDPPVIDSLSDVDAVLARVPIRARKATLPDDVSASMLGMLQCARLARLPAGPGPVRDSLELRCNLR